MKARTTLVIAALLSACAVCAQPAPKARTERIETKQGIVTTTFVPRATASDVAVAFYPRARAASGSRYEVKTAKGKLAKLRAEVTLTTRDKPAKIAQFYQKALAGAQLRWDQPNAKATLWKKADGKAWIITIRQGSVHIRHSESRVDIQLPEIQRERPRGRRQST